MKILTSQESFMVGISCACFLSSSCWLFPLTDASTMLDHNLTPSNRLLLPHGDYFTLLLHMYFHSSPPGFVLWEADLHGPQHLRYPAPLTSGWISLITGHGGKLKKRRVSLGSFYLSGHDPVAVVYYILKPQLLLSISLPTITTHPKLQDLLPLLVPSYLNAHLGNITYPPWFS